MDVSLLLDSMWVLVSAFLVFFMHAGFALVESGLCRRKNAVMVLLKNVGVVSMASVLYFAVGYGFMFGEGSLFVGLGNFMPGPEGSVGTLPTYVFLFFQLVFAAAAATIVSGAVAERVRLGPFFVFTAVATTFIYPVAGHWVWGGGFLSRLGFHDFAGSSVVHGVGGAMALAGVLTVGPRLGRYGRDGTPRPMPAHNFPLAALGVLILWLGWFGFNGGSTLAADPEAIGSVILVTNLAGAVGFLSALAYVRYRTGMLDLSMGLNGVLGGLVAITAGADVIGPLGSMVVGFMAGVLIVEGVFWLDRRRLDDPVGAIAVHGMAGIFGTLAVGFFADAPTQKGLLFGGGFTLLGIQAVGALAVSLFAFLAGLGTWQLLSRLPGGVRVEGEHEVEGLDRSECGVDAYGDGLPGLGTTLETTSP